MTIRVAYCSFIFTAGGGESDTLAVLNENACVKCIQDNRDVIVGVKIRLTADICDMGRTEHEAFR